MLYRELGMKEYHLKENIISIFSYLTVSTIQLNKENTFENIHAYSI